MDAEWDLVPSRFRPNNLLEKSAAFHEEPLQTRYSEYSNIKRFVQLCDREGLMPSGFTLRANSESESSWWHDVEKMIPYEVLNVYALAQHHGIQTRLLDWSTTPLSAAYFASKDNWRNSIDPETYKPEYFAVWAFPHHGSRQVKILKPRFTDNLYLRSQKGCFSYDPNADKNYKRNGFWTPHNHLIVEDEEVSDGTIGTGSELLIKFIAPSSISEEMLILLRYEGIDQASLMPSLDSIASYTKDDLLLHKRESGYRK